LDWVGLGASEARLGCRTYSVSGVGREGKGIVGRAEEPPPLRIEVTSGVGEAGVSVQSAGDVGRCAVYREEGRKREEKREVSREKEKRCIIYGFLKVRRLLGRGMRRLW